MPGRKSLNDESDTRPAGRIPGLIAVAAFLRFVTLGAYPLIDPTEGRYASIALEILDCGDWTVLHLPSGTPFWGKPPLYMWLTALSYKTFGVSEFSARLPAYLMALLAGVSVFMVGRVVGGKDLGVLAAGILTTTGLFYVCAGIAATDPVLLGVVTVTLATFVLSLEAGTPGTRRNWGVVFFIFLGITPLAKGLVGWIFVILPIVIWASWMRQWKIILESLPWRMGLCVTVLISVPWFVLCEIKSPGFLRYFFIGEHFKRFLITNWPGDLYGSPHQAPFGTIWIYFLLTGLPWGVLGVIYLFIAARATTLKTIHHTNKWFSFLVVWWLTPLLFFSLARNVMMTYVLPSLPPLALVTALLIRSLRTLEKNWVRNWIPVGFGLLGLMAFVPLLFLGAAFTVIQQKTQEKSQKNAVEFVAQLQQDFLGDLVYHDRMPFSAYFYSRGTAKEVRDRGLNQLFDELNDSDRDFFLIRNRHLNCLTPEFLEKTDIVGERGKYLILRETAAGGYSETP